MATTTWSASTSTRWRCPFTPICDPIVNGMIVRFDDNHLTDSFVRTLADPLDDHLTEQRVFT